MTGPLLALLLSAAQLSEAPQFQRITFSLPHPSGVGTVQGAAGRLQYQADNSVSAVDGVNLLYRNLSVQADEIHYDPANGQVEASGNVILDEGPRRLAGERLTFDLESQTGTIYEGKAYVDPDIYFAGEEIHKTGEDTYRVHKGVITSCDDEVPDWSFRISRATVRVEGFARVYNTRAKVKKMPFFYFPFMMFPAKEERASGFLFPNFGTSQQLGTVIGAAYYQTLGESFDTTFFVDDYSEGFTAFGNEFRYAPSVYTRGTFEGYVVEDPGDIFETPAEGEVPEEETRWRINWRHKSDKLPLGMKLGINVFEFSDFLFFRDFSRSFDDINIRRTGSSGFLSGNWGNHQFSLLAENVETFFRRDTTIKRRQLPEAAYRLNQTRLGRLPVYFGLQSSFNAFQLAPTGFDTVSYTRGDIAPSLTVPVNSFPWLAVSLGLSGRATFWSDSLTDDRAEFTGESLSRTFGSARAEIVGPSFSKVFQNGTGAFGKFKHIIEPRWVYQNSGNFEDQDLVPFFDEIDPIQPTHALTFSLVNRLLAKPKDEDNPFGTREIASFELRQAYSFDDEQPFQTLGEESLQTSPIAAIFRFRPSPATSLDVQANYNTLFGEFNNASLSGRTQAGKSILGLSWFARFDPETGATQDNQIRASAAFNLFRDRVLYGTQVNYNVEEDLVQQHSHVFQYNSQCWGIRLEWREFESLVREDRDLRFALSLKNIGTFLDLNSSTRASRGNSFF